MWQELRIQTSCLYDTGGDSIRKRRSVVTAFRDLWSRWPVRALTLAAGIKLVFWLLGTSVQSFSLVVLVDAATTLVVVVSLGYVLVGSLMKAQRRLLWRVRRKLILSYLFIGLIPVVLVGAFFVLAGTLALLSASSFLVTLSMDDLVDQANRAADQVALDLQEVGDGSDIDLSRYRRRLQREHPDVSLSLVGATADGGPLRLSTGPWHHGAPPTAWPSWLSPAASFSGLVLFETNGEPHLVARALEPVTTGSVEGVVVDMPVGAEMREDVLAATGVAMSTAGTTPVEASSGALAWVEVDPEIRTAC